MIWSFNIRSAFPLVTAAGARWGSRLPSMWLLPALYWEDMPKAQSPHFRRLDARPEAERFLDSIVARDLEEHAPALLIVLSPSRDSTANGFERLDYRSYFTGDPRIARTLQCYRFVQRVGVHDVYERWSGGQCPSGG
jgi:hypothetical protein